MEWKRALLYILILIPMIEVSISMFFFPDQVPIHIGSDGVANNWNSKYYLFTLPTVAIVFGVVLLLVEKNMRKNSNSDAYIMFGCNMIFLMLINVITVYFLYSVSASI